MRLADRLVSSATSGSMPSFAGYDVRGEDDRRRNRQHRHVRIPRAGGRVRRTPRKTPRARAREHSHRGFRRKRTGVIRTIDPIGDAAEPALSPVVLSPLGAVERGQQVEVQRSRVMPLKARDRRRPAASPWVARACSSR